jgi:Tfp pilus assembly PilM family ATPase
MLNIAINTGSYSIKFLNFKIEKKKIIYLASREVILDSDEFNILEDDIVLDLQIKVISDYLKEIDQEYKVIMNASNEMITERFIDLPLKNKKKANLMLPFQLEEDIPYSLSDCKISSTLEPTKDGNHASVNIIKHELLRPLFQKINEYKINPSILTSEISTLETFVKNTTEVLPQAFCILDLGHNTTHAYFFMDGQLKSTHTSYVAGYAVNEIISKAYSISLEEAAIYKHQNSFFLTSDQYEDVDQSQKDFAKLMEDTMAPLITEFDRWHIGFRVQNGVAVSDTFLVGGTSNIKNLPQFLTEKISMKVGTMNFFGNADIKKIDNDEKQKKKFALANVEAHGMMTKSKIINFLTGEYAIQGEADIPLHSMTFIASRMMFISLICILGLTVEGIFLSKQIKSADKKIKGLVKNPILRLNGRDARSALKKPKGILNKLERQTKTINQEVKVLQSSLDINALRSLEMISRVTTGLKVEVIQYQSVSKSDFVVVFKGQDEKAINDLNDILKGSSIKNLFIDTNLAKKTLTVNGSEE